MLRTSFFDEVKLIRYLNAIIKYQLNAYGHLHATELSEAQFPNLLTLASDLRRISMVGYNAKPRSNGRSVLIIMTAKGGSYTEK